MGASLDVRDLLQEAASFAQAGDVTAAVSRAKAAARTASDEESRAIARVELERLEARERAWRAEIAAREAAFLAQERAKADVADEE